MFVILFSSYLLPLIAKESQIGSLIVKFVVRIFDGIQAHHIAYCQIRFKNSGLRW